MGADVSDVQDWLQEHEAELAGIAHELDDSSALVRCAAVFALAGMKDAEILQQLRELLHWLDGQADPLARAQRTLKAVRRLVPSTQTTH